MRKDPSSLAHERSEFIQYGSHDDSNTSITHNINSVENIVGDCEVTPNAMAKNRALDNSIVLRNTIVKFEQRDEKSLMGIDHQIVEEEDNTSVTFLSSCGSSQSDATEDPSTLSKSSIRACSSPKDMKRVRFGNCSIRSYDQILGDHPVCAVGCPIALGWNVVGEECFSVDDHESIRIPLRKQKGAKLSQQHRRRKLVSSGDEPSTMESSFKYMNSQLKLSAHERRDRLRDYSDAQIRKEWSRNNKRYRRAMIKEGLRQFRMVGMHYAGY